MEKRRNEIRMLCADVVDVTWRERGGRTRRGTALLEDISPSGACLQADVTVPAGAVIHWQAAGHEFTGVVRYCVFREIGYFMGVEFAPDSKWSRETFEPEHLLDLKSLMGGCG